MLKNLSIFNFKKLPIAFVVTLFLIFFIEYIGLPILIKNSSSQIFLYSQPAADDAVRFETQIQMSDKKSKLIYLLGSSQAREDIDTDIINDNLKLNGYSGYHFVNLGVSGGDPIDLYLQGEKILEKDPDIIIIMPFRGGFYGKYEILNLKNYLYSLDRLRGLIKIYGTKKFLIDAAQDWVGIASALIFPSHKYKNFLIGSVGASFSGRGRREKPLWYAYNERKNEEYFRKEIEENLKNDPAIDINASAKKLAFRTLIREIVKKHIKLIVIDGPINPRINELEKKYSLIWNDYSFFMDKEAQHFNYVYVNYKDFPLLAEEDYIDFTHLNSVGREKFSNYLFYEVLLPLLSNKKQRMDF